jgi:hypothetical protein
VREIKTTSKLPNWFTTGDADYAIVADMPEIGYSPDLPPRIPTRVIPRNGGGHLSFDSLSDILLSIQHTVISVAHELVYGVDLFFRDMRKISKEVTQFARVHAEPFEEGSFIIHAELDDRTTEIGGKKVTTRQVVERYVEVLSGIAKEGHEFPTSLAVLHSIEEMDKALKRDVARVELAPSGSYEQEAFSSPVVIDPDYVIQVMNARLHRLSRRTEYGSIKGVLRAVDTTQRRFKLEVERGRPIVPGEYIEELEVQMILALGKSVQITGYVSYLGGAPHQIKATLVDTVSNQLAPFKRG